VSEGHPSVRAVLGGSGMVGRGSVRHVALLLLIALRAQAQTAPATPPAAASPAPATSPAAAAPPPAGTDPAAPPAAAPAAPPSPATAPAPTAPPPASADPAEATQIVRRGHELAARHDYAGALVEYQRAYDLLPDYNVLYSIGAANVRLERWAAARQAFATYLDLGGSALPQARQDEVRNYLEILQKQTATLSLLLNVPDAEVHIDGVRVAPTSISGIVVEPGNHVLRVTKPGFRTVEDEFHATKGESVRVVLPLTRVSTLGPAEPIAPGALTVSSSAPPPVVEPEPTPLWVPWTLTGVLAAGWITTAALAIQARHDRDTIEQPGTPEHRIDAARRLHVSLAVASDVLLAATLVSGGISAYLTWWPSEPARAGAGLGPASVGGLGAGFSGQF